MVHEQLKNRRRVERHSHFQGTPHLLTPNNLERGIRGATTSMFSGSQVALKNVTAHMSPLYYPNGHTYMEFKTI